MSEEENVDFMQLEENQFGILMEILNIDVPFECDICGKEVNKENYGILHRDIKTCRSILCKIAAIDRLKEEADS